MPLYEYECPHCCRQMELLQRLSDLPPHCSFCIEKHSLQIQMTKRISRTNFSLKGSGWYKDHYGLKPSSGDGDS